ncbi:unnamed protein product [Rodentolepis nana]|uniref:USP domain-containing protein n=1 Tax=Rodentolepis nana TaxID=102285 RepID=A0A0R3TAJ8_RODNA|nr:unnamed protein product [Rodentolepis nana]
MSTTCSVASFKQIANHANLSNNTNGFCTNLNQTVAASLSDRTRFVQAPTSLTLLGKPLPFVFSNTLPLEESIKEKFKNLHNTSVLSDTSRSRVQDAYDREVLEYCSQGDLKVPSVPMGLTNFGNYCYQNSTLQALLASGPLLYFVLEKHKPTECSLSKISEFCSLCEFGAFHHYEQEDAQEYLSGVVASFVNCFEQSAGKKSKGRNIVEKMFYGSTLQLVTCSTCRNVSCVEHPYVHVPLNIGDCYSLQHILATQKGIEIIDDYDCATCKIPSTAERRDLIFKAPPILTFHLIRFFGVSKIHTYIRFPLSLDLRPYMASVSGPSLNYQLYAMIIHEGPGITNGHYVACTNHGGKWYRISDSVITEVNVQEVLSMKPYILLYKLVNPEDLLSTQEDLDKVRREAIQSAAAGRASSPAPQISNNSINQKFIFPWRSPHGPLLNSSNSTALLPRATPRTSMPTFASNVSSSLEIFLSTDSSGIIIIKEVSFCFFVFRGSS